MHLFADFPHCSSFRVYGSLRLLRCPSQSRPMQPKRLLDGMMPLRLEKHLGWREVESVWHFSDDKKLVWTSVARIIDLFKTCLAVWPWKCPSRYLRSLTSRHRIWQKGLLLQRRGKCLGWQGFIGVEGTEHAFCRHRGWPFHFVGDRTSGFRGEVWRLSLLRRKKWKRGSAQDQPNNETIVKHVDFFLYPWIGLDWVCW